MGGSWVALEIWKVRSTQSQTKLVLELELGRGLKIIRNIKMLSLAIFLLEFSWIFSRNIFIPEEI